MSDNPERPMINLARPVRGPHPSSVRGRQAFTYRCPDCGAETSVLASSFRGPRPVPGTGGIRCPKCDK